jgi:tryptophan synthase alpha chain
MNGLSQILATFANKKTAFMPYAPLGYPTIEDSLEVIRTLVKAGADLIELGVPFSDPLADGPTIQAATQKALENGVNVAKCLELAKQLRAEGIITPFLLMGYLNPFLAYGLEQLVNKAVEAGINGFIIPDLPPEEADELDGLCVQNNLALIYFLAPTSTPERLTLVAQKARGFIYLVSLTGVTGARNQLSETLPAFIERVRGVTDKPLAVGFGISNGQQARQVAQYADGVIVGSALVKRAAQSSAAVGELAAEIAVALS